MVYWEFLLDAKEKTYDIAKELGMDEYWDWNIYQPRPVWTPCDAHNVDEEEYPLYAFSWADTFHSNSNNHNLRWIDEVSQMNPYSYFINMHENTANKLGFKSGDHVRVQTDTGYEVDGYLKTRQGIRPDCVGMMGVSGHWAKGLPVAKNKGINFNTLIDFSIKNMDPLTCTVDILVKIKMTKIDSAKMEVQAHG